MQATMDQNPAGSVSLKANISLNMSSIGFAYAAEILHAYAAHMVQNKRFATFI